MSNIKYYYRNGQKVPIAVLETAYVMRLDGERSVPPIQGWITQSITDQYALIVREDVVSKANFDNERGKIDVYALIKAIVEMEQAASEGERTATMIIASRPTLIKRPDLRIFPVANHKDSNGVLFSNGEIIAQFPIDVDMQEIDRLAKSMSLYIVRRISFLQNGYVLGLSSNEDPIECANNLVEQKKVLWAHPVFLENIPERDASLPVINGKNVPSLLSKQWHLENSGRQGSIKGIDISAFRAWSITSGSPTIVACVIDSGVNLAHESFRSTAKLIPGYDFQDNDTDPNPTVSSHGTSCAALIVAGPTSGDVLGVAPNCRLIPIRRPNVTNHLSLAESFVWAADNGADVISCSFGIDGQPWVLPDIARASLDYVTSKGRRGKGCPIFWAAGNGSELVSTDEWASSNFTIAVAASTDQGHRAKYSDYGPEISICSPSSGGANGITTAKNNGYTYEFGGTSAAAPIAAGVACLVLSVAPNMRQSEIKSLLEKTARKIDLENGVYSTEGISPYYGHGQIDAFAALLGIPALLEVERATSTEGLDAGIQSVIAYLKVRAAGSAILSYLDSRRLNILKEIQVSKSFCNSVGRILRVISLIGASLDTETEILIPDEIWQDVDLVLRQVKAMEIIAFAPE